MVLGWLGMKTAQFTEVWAPAIFPMTLDNYFNFSNLKISSQVKGEMELEAYQVSFHPKSMKQEIHE